MYSTLEKKGKILALWGDTNGVAAVSTTTALIAAGLASREKNVLVLTTDPGPYDAVSMTSDLVRENTLDDLLILASSGGLRTADDFTSYTVPVSEHLSCMRGSDDLMKVSVSAAEGLHYILDMARGIYDYIVVDLYGRRSGINDRIMNDADLIIACLSQNRKHMARLLSDSVFTSVLNGKDVMMVISRYQIYPFLSVKQEERMLNVKGCYTLSEDDDIHKAASSLSVADYVFGHIDGESKGLLNRKKTELSAAMSELNGIVDDIEEKFKEEEEKKPGLFDRFRKKKEPEPELEPEEEEPEEMEPKEKPFIHRGGVMEADPEEEEVPKEPEQEVSDGE